MPLPDPYPEALSDMADCIRQRLCLSLPSAQVGPVTLDIIEDIRTYFGGGLIYIPKGTAMDRAQRNKAIVAEFNGENHRDLARRHGLSVTAIYGIITRAKRMSD